MSSSEIAHDFSPHLRVYKDGRVERLEGTTTVPPSYDQNTGVLSKDVAISASTPCLSARVYIPTDTTINNHSDAKRKKVPLLVYFHGGAFCLETPFSPMYHNYLNSLVSEANAVAVSVHYRRAPEHPLPAAYDDSWTALEWVSSHSGGDGPDDWLNTYADLRKVYVAGDSAGGNIAHHMGLRYGCALKTKTSDWVEGIDLRGIILVQPFFMGNEPVGNERTDQATRSLLVGLWHLACPSATDGCDDPQINPEKDPRLSSMGCARVLIFVAERDVQREREWLYRDLLVKSEWEGTVEVMEAKGEDHQFHLFHPTSNDAVNLMRRFVSFLNENEIRHG
ncbi:hypothetical protein BT93_G1019 [Corymbia citriodora subsp. variegata]|nr:hypothetical protein BT93_G1019 [Corymbia citriodora subsp. variegata]